MVSDQGYREWEAVKQAVNELIGAVDWVLDPANNQITYVDPNQSQEPFSKHYYQPAGQSYKCYSLSSCKSAVQASNLNNRVNSCSFRSSGNMYCSITFKSGQTINYDLIKYVNPNYDPTAEPYRKTIPLDVVAQQVISNAASSVEITEMMANTFIQAVKDNALNPDENKQIIKYVDILGQWEENKWQLV